LNSYFSGDKGRAKNNKNGRAFQQKKAKKAVLCKKVPIKDHFLNIRKKVDHQFFNPLTHRTTHRYFIF